MTYTLTAIAVAATVFVIAAEEEPAPAASGASRPHAAVAGCWRPRDRNDAAVFLIETNRSAVLQGDAAVRYWARYGEGGATLKRGAAVARVRPTPVHDGLTIEFEGGRKAASERVSDTPAALAFDPLPLGPPPAAPVEPIAVAPLLVEAGDPPPAAVPFVGCWRNVAEPKHVLWLLPHKCVQVAPGRRWPQGDPVEYRPGVVAMGRPPESREWKAVVADDRLTLVRDKTEVRFERLPEPPRDVAALHTPLPVGRPGPLAPERIAAIAADLAARHRQDQAARDRLAKNPKAGWEEIDKIDEENRDHLAGLLAEVGWPDVGRFGFEPAYHAYMLAMHAPHDWRLMQAVVPEIERDVRLGRFDPKLYVALHQRARISLGEADRYGLIAHDPKTGEPFVGKLEDDQRVDEFRKQIGLPPLAEELARTPPLSADVLRRLSGSAAK